MRKNIPGKSLIVVLLSAATGCALPVARSVEPERTVQFLLINDVYIGEPMENGLGGIARLKTLKRQLEANGPVKLMLAGDFLFPSLLSKWYKGSQMVEYLNEAGLDYATFGNHEFDDSRETLVRRIAESRFKWTSANCKGSDGAPIPGVSEWDTATISGVKLGIVGVTVLMPYPRWIKCVNPDSAVHATIPRLRAAGAEVIVGLTHVFLSEDSTLLANEPDIDFILGGHEHTPQLVTVINRFVVKADRNAQTAQLVTLARHDGKWRASHRLIQLDASIPEDPNAAQLVARWQDSLEMRLGPAQVIATSPVALDASNIPVRSRETAFGNLVADAIRSGTGADVAAMIGGAMRYDDEIPAGVITNRHIESIYLFPDETRIATFRITGAKLRQILEHSVSRGGAVFGGYLQLSGVSFSWDSGRVVGQRIIGDLRRTDGTVIAPSDTIKFSINAYAACDGGDGYSIPESADACTVREAGPRAAQLAIDYLRRMGTISLPPLGRVTRMQPTQ